MSSGRAQGGGAEQWRLVTHAAGGRRDHATAADADRARAARAATERSSERRKPAEVASGRRCAGSSPERYEAWRLSAAARRAGTHLPMQSPRRHPPRLKRRATWPPTGFAAAAAAARGGGANKSGALAPADAPSQRLSARSGRYRRLSSLRHARSAGAGLPSTVRRPRLKDAAGRSSSGRARHTHRMLLARFTQPAPAVRVLAPHGLEGPARQTTTCA